MRGGGRRGGWGAAQGFRAGPRPFGGFVPRPHTYTWVLLLGELSVGSLWLVCSAGQGRPVGSPWMGAPCPPAASASSRLTQAPATLLRAHAAAPPPAGLPLRGVPGSTGERQACPRGRGVPGPRAPVVPDWLCSVRPALKGCSPGPRARQRGRASLGPAGWGRRSGCWCSTEQTGGSQAPTPVPPFPRLLRSMCPGRGCPQASAAHSMWGWSEQPGSSWEAWAGSGRGRAGAVTRTLWGHLPRALAGGSCPWPARAAGPAGHGVGGGSGTHGDRPAIPVSGGECGGGAGGPLLGWPRAVGLGWGQHSPCPSLWP